LLEKLKETGVSVSPIMLIVLALSLTIAPIPGALLVKFLLGGILIIIGLGVFLLGTDIGILPVGQDVGSALVHRRSLPLMLAVGFLVGFIITVAEPDVQVLANQVAKVDASIPKNLLIAMIGLGVGFFVSVSFGRIILGLSYRWLLLGFYAAVFILAALTDQAYVAVAFDAGGATTGPMTVPFIMALGVGVAAVRRGKDAEGDSFGLVGLASIGPIMAVLAMGIISKGGVAEGAATGAAAATAGAEGAAAAASLGVPGILGDFLHLAPETAAEAARALGPLAAMFLAFQLLLLKMPPYRVARMAKGLLYSFAGLVLFLVGVNGGFLPAGSAIGERIGAMAGNWVLIPIGLVFGAVVVLAEPAVWVLNNQVEEVSGGAIKKEAMLASLSIGVAVAVGIAMLRVVTGISIWWFLIPGYALALSLTFFCPPLFTAIAFDSGGVASGPMSSTFILAFTLGASRAAGGNPLSDAFGVIAMIAMTPLIMIQILGLVFSFEEKKAKALRDRAALEDASR
jgi:hypothetical protein